MDIEFSCSNCGQRLSFEETGDGITVQCPGCGQETNLQTGILRIAVGVLSMSGDTPTSKETLQKLQDLIDQQERGEISEMQARGEMREFNDSIGYEPKPGTEGTIQDLSSDGRLNLIFRTTTSLVAAARNWDVWSSPMSLKLYPCQELRRKFNVRHPRESSDGVGNRYWFEKWQRLGGQFYEGRMMCRKDAAVCSEISEFGLPFGPPGFGSGYRWRQVSYDESTRLGVVATKEHLELPPLDLERFEKKMREHFELLISPETQRKSG